MTRVANCWLQLWYVVCWKTNKQKKKNLAKFSHGPWVMPTHIRIFRAAADPCRLLCACWEVVEVRRLLCPVCPSQPPPSSAGRSSSWAHAGVDPAGLQCHHSSPLRALTGHWPAGETKSPTSYDLQYDFMPKNYIYHKSAVSIIEIIIKKHWPLSACLCCPVAASLCACKHGLSTS